MRGVSPVVVEEILVVIGIVAAAALFAHVLPISQNAIISSNSNFDNKHEVKISASAVVQGENVVFCTYLSSDEEFDYNHLAISISSQVGSLGTFTEFNGTCSGAIGPNPCSACVSLPATPSTYTIRVSCDECVPATAVVSVG